MSKNIICTIETFTNHHNGAVRFRQTGVQPLDFPPNEIIEYRSQDNFRPSPFGNGTTVKKIWYKVPPKDWADDIPEEKPLREIITHPMLRKRMGW